VPWRAPRREGASGDLSSPADAVLREDNPSSVDRHEPPLGLALPVLADRDRSWAPPAGEAHRQTPVRTPVANAHAERLVRTARRECFDWTLIRIEQHLAHVIREYLEHHNRERPHRGLDLRPPDPPAQPGTGRIQRLDRLRGLIHH
jgi:transposase InsO family protein